MNGPTRANESSSGEVFGVLARRVPSRLIEISRSGCLLESSHPVEQGTVGELRFDVGGEELVDDVRVTRCVRVEGAGSSYLVGAEFVQTRRPSALSIRRAVTAILRGVEPAQSGMVKPQIKRGERGALASAKVVNSESTGEGAMKDLLARFVREDEGQDLIEYGLLAGLITTLVVTAITAIGQKVLGYFTALNTALEPAP